MTTACSRTDTNRHGSTCPQPAPKKGFCHVPELHPGTEARYRVEDLEGFVKSILTDCPVTSDHIAALEDGALLAKWFSDDAPEVQEAVEEVHAEMAATLCMRG